MSSDSRFCQVSGCDGELDISGMESDGDDVYCRKCGADHVAHVTVEFTLIARDEDEED